MAMHKLLLVDKVCGVSMTLKDVFNLDNKSKSYVKIPNYTCLGHHNIHTDVYYYARMFDNANIEFMEAKIVPTGNKVFNKYTLGAGTSIKILDAFMLNALFADSYKKYECFVTGTLKKAFNFDDKKAKEEFKKHYKFELPTTKEKKKALEQGFKILYNVRNDKENKIEQIYAVFVKEVKQKVFDVDLDYIVFKPMQYITKMEYIKGKSNDKYNVIELQEICVPKSLIK